MTTLLQARRIRLAADAGKKTSFKMVDQLNGGTPELWRGNDVRFEIGLHLSETILSSIANIATITLEVRTTRTGTVLMTKTITSGDLTACTAAAWADYTGQHAVIEFTGTETNLDLGSATDATYWLVISATTTDSPGKSITLGVTDLKLVEDGAGTAGTPPVNDNLYYTKGETDARYVPLHQDSAFMQRYNGLDYIYIASTGLWYPIVGAIVNGVPTLTLGEGVSL